MHRFSGLIGIAVIFGIAYLISNNRKAISYRLVFTGLALQILLAFFILKIPLGQMIFARIGFLITKMLEYANHGANFVFGVLVDEKQMNNVFGMGKSFIFVFRLIPTIIFVCVLVAIAYHIGLLQKIVSFLARLMHKVMRVSGSEALSNISSAFVGQVEAQIMIQPYLKGMTKSELMASMTGSFACIAGGVMAVYISMGVRAEYLLAASLMAAPAALVISKIVMPETEESETQGIVKLEVKKTHANLLDAIAHGASEGMRVSINVIAMLIGLLALIYLVDGGLGFTGRLIGRYTHASLSGIGLDINHLNLRSIIGLFFGGFAYVMGVPWNETHAVGSLMGTKFVINEFVAYTDLTAIKQVLSPKALAITSFALCGFANFGSVAIQIGGIGELAPGRRKDLARLGIKALICGTLTNYLSATIAGIML